jgi:phospholipid transport system substrate-binding protein
MSNTATSPADRVRRFAVIVDRNLDVPKLAQFVLRRYWQTAGDSERTDFVNVFRDYIVRVYANHFSLYLSDSFWVTDQRAESATTTIVRTSIIAIATGQAMILEWRVIKGPEGFKVNDLTVDGVSLATVQREEFASEIQRDGGKVSILTNQVRSKLMRLETAEQ